MKKPVADAASRAPVVLVADGGLRHALPPSTDPIADWIDLMDTVEAICPQWPAREVLPVTWGYRLYCARLKPNRSPLRSTPEGLGWLQKIAQNRANVFTALMEAVKSYSLGPILHALYDVGEEYRGYI